jgi:hypothetical protein
MIVKLANGWVTINVGGGHLIEVGQTTGALRQG